MNDNYARIMEGQFKLHRAEEVNGYRLTKKGHESGVDPEAIEWWTDYAEVHATISRLILEYQLSNGLKTGEKING